MRMFASFLLVSAGPLPLTAMAAPSVPATQNVDPATIPLAPGEGRAFAAKLASELTSNFVFPEQGAAYAAMIRKNAAAGRYDTGTRGDVAKRVNDDLMAVHKDGHLHVSVTHPADRENGGDGGPIPD